MEWVQITTAGILSHLPTDVSSRYTTWLASNPDRAGRLAEITANTIREFRDAIKSVPANSWHVDETYLPQSAVRHCENIIIFTLCMEMGIPIDTAGISAFTSANIYLRQIPYGRMKMIDQDEIGLGSPSYAVPEASAGRALPSMALVFFLCVARTMGGWIETGRYLSDTEIATTFTPSAYSITTATLFGHLQGINAAIAAAASSENIVLKYAATEIRGPTNQYSDAPNLTIVAGESAPWPADSQGGYLYLSGGRNSMGTYSPVVIENSDLYAPSLTAPLNRELNIFGYMRQLAGYTAGAVRVSGGIGLSGSLGGNLYLSGGPGASTGSVYISGANIFTGPLTPDSITLNGETRTTWPGSGTADASAWSSYAATTTVDFATNAIQRVTEIVAPEGAFRPTIDLVNMRVMNNASWWDPDGLTNKWGNWNSDYLDGYDSTAFVLAGTTVASLNSATGALQIVAGSNVTVEVVGTNLTINASASGGGSVTNLGDLADVNLSGANEDDVLGFDGTNWTPRAQTGGGITNGQTGVTLAGTFTGAHSGDGTSLANVADTTARESAAALGDGIHPRSVALVTNGTAYLYPASNAWWRVNCTTNPLTNWSIDTSTVTAGDTVALGVEIYRPSTNTWAWPPTVTNASPATNATSLHLLVLISGATNWLVNP